MAEVQRKPFIVIAPGAWHPGSMYCRFQAELQMAGYPTYCDSVPSLLGVKDQTCADDTAFLRERVVRILDCGHDVVLVAHSYGTTYGCAAVAGLSKEARAERNEKNGVIGVVCVGMILTAEGNSIAKSYYDAIDPQEPPTDYLESNKPSEGFQIIKDVPTMLGGAPPLLNEALTQMLLPQNMHAMVTPAPKPAWSEPGFHGRLACVIPMNDQAAPPSLERNTMALTGVEWKVHEIKDASHGVLMTKPDECARLVTKLCGEFNAL